VNHLVAVEVLVLLDIRDKRLIEEQRIHGGGVEAEGRGGISTEGILKNLGPDLNMMNYAMHIMLPK